MNVASLLQDSPSEDHRSRQQQPPDTQQQPQKRDQHQQQLQQQPQPQPPQPPPPPPQQHQQQQQWLSPYIRRPYVEGANPSSPWPYRSHVPPDQSQSIIGPTPYSNHDSRPTPPGTAPTTGPRVRPPSSTPNSGYMPPPPPPPYSAPPSQQPNKSIPTGPTPLYPTPVAISAPPGPLQTPLPPRPPASHSPPLSSYSDPSSMYHPPPPGSSTVAAGSGSGPPSTQRRVPPPVQGPPSSHPSPAMASLRPLDPGPPGIGVGAWGPPPGASGDPRDREARELSREEMMRREREQSQRMDWERDRGRDEGDNRSRMGIGMGLGITEELPVSHLQPPRTAPASSSSSRDPGAGGSSGSGRRPVANPLPTLNPLPNVGPPMDRKSNLNMNPNATPGVANSATSTTGNIDLNSSPKHPVSANPSNKRSNTTPIPAAGPSASPLDEPMGLEHGKSSHGPMERMSMMGRDRGDLRDRERDRDLRDRGREFRERERDGREREREREAEEDMEIIRAVARQQAHSRGQLPGLGGTGTPGPPGPGLGMGMDGPERERDGRVSERDLMREWEREDGGRERDRGRGERDRGGERDRVDRERDRDRMARERERMGLGMPPYPNHHSLPPLPPGSTAHQREREGRDMRDMRDARDRDGRDARERDVLKDRERERDMSDAREREREKEQHSLHGVRHHHHTHPHLHPSHPSSHPHLHPGSIHQQQAQQQQQMLAHSQHPSSHPSHPHSLAHPHPHAPHPHQHSHSHPPHLQQQQGPPQQQPHPHPHQHHSLPPQGHPLGSGGPGGPPLGPGQPPPQRQFQNQFHTQFVPGLAAQQQPGGPSLSGGAVGSRMGSPVGVMGVGIIGGGGVGVIGPGGGVVGGVGGGPSGRERERERERERREKDGKKRGKGRDITRERERDRLGAAPPGGGAGWEVIESEQREIQHIDMVMMAGPDAEGAHAHGYRPEHGYGYEAGYGVEYGDDGYLSPFAYRGEYGNEGDEGEDGEGKEVKARASVSLGTYVFPKVPFPYFFDAGVGAVAQPEVEVSRAKEEGMEVDGTEPEVVVGEVKNEEKTDERDAEKEEADKEREKQTKEGAGRQSDGADKAGSDLLKQAKQPITESVKEKEEEKNLVDVETRTTIIIPNGYIPLEKPSRPRIWGGGVVERENPSHRRGGPTRRGARPSQGRRNGVEVVASANKTNLKGKGKRRVYTDDSDLFLCCVHAGWVTWSGARRARREGKDMKVELRVLRCVGSVEFSGAGAGTWGAVGAIGSETPRASLKEEVVGRFVGGWGEKCFTPTDKSARSRRNGYLEDVGVVAMNEEEDREDDDGRGLVSAGWGSGHDGSGIEILGVEFLEKGTARTAPGLGPRNRSQRIAEYNERRASVLPPVSTRNASSRLVGRKRRRGWDWPMQHLRRPPNSTVSDLTQEDETGDVLDVRTSDEQLEVADETLRMTVRTVMFGLGHSGDVQVGFKYDPTVLKDVLFPTSQTARDFRQPPPKKRRRVEDGAESTEATMDIDSEDDRATSPEDVDIRPLILETPKERYLLVPSVTETGRKYEISLFLQGEVPNFIAEPQKPLEKPKDEEIALKTPSETEAHGPIVARDPSPSAVELEPTPQLRVDVLSDIPLISAEAPLPSSQELTLISEAVAEPHSVSSPHLTVPPDDSEQAAMDISPLSSPPPASSPLPEVPSLPDAEGEAPNGVFPPQPCPATPPPSGLSAAPGPSQYVTVTEPSPTADKSLPDQLPPLTETPTLADSSTTPGDTPKQSALQVLQRHIPEDAFQFVNYGVKIADISNDGLRTEWIIRVKRWKWASTSQG